MKRMIVVAASALAVTFAVAFSGKRGYVDADRHGIGEVVQAIEGLDALRSSLAASFQGEPDEGTFAKVCRPVGAQAQRLAMEKGWTIGQLAERYRDPGNKLDFEARRVFKMMEDDESLIGMWVETELDGKPGIRYFRRIVVEPACLACHGTKAGRPQFVKDGYPADRAYGFEVGDLRGVYAVFVAD